MENKYLRKLDIKLIDGEFENVKGKIRDPRQLYTTFLPIRDKSQETLIGVYFTDDMRVKTYSTLSVGTPHETIFSPQEIFKYVFITKSHYFALIHNHPKGDPKPSNEDKLAIADIHEKSKTLELSFLDFVIIGRDSYWSMFESMDGGEYSLGTV